MCWPSVHTCAAASKADIRTLTQATVLAPITTLNVDLIHTGAPTNHPGRASLSGARLREHVPGNEPQARITSASVTSPASLSSGQLHTAHDTAQVHDSGHRYGLSWGQAPGQPRCPTPTTGILGNQCSKDHHDPSGGLSTRWL